MKKILLSASLLAIAQVGLAQVPDVFISEYFDGSSNKNAIEIINKSGTALDLSKIRVVAYYNGGTTGASAITTTKADDATTTTIPVGDLFVYYFTGASGFTTETFPNAVASKKAGVSVGGGLGFNGNDAVTIEYNTSGTTWEIADILGRIGEDPTQATGWNKMVSGQNVTTAARSIYRKTSITTGIKTNPTAATFDISTEWGVNYGGAAPTFYNSLGEVGQTTVGTLPIQLINFKGTASNSGNLLSWITASEKDNAYFEVLSSTNGSSFNVIAKITGATNSSESLNYNFLDRKVAKGLTYYTLRQVDLNGDKTDFSTIQVTNSLTSTADDLLILSTGNQLSAQITSMQKDNVVIDVYNLQGQKKTTQRVQLENGVNNHSIDHNLSAGLYIISVVGNNTLITKKFVIQ